jgi:3-polyprenyl-4-hydroxybenzoate decarboxylase
VGDRLDAAPARQRRRREHGHRLNQAGGLYVGVKTGDTVDLAATPYPLMHLFDGGPYISGTFVVSKDPEFGRGRAPAAVVSG